MNTHAVANYVPNDALTSLVLAFFMRWYHFHRRGNAAYGLAPGKLRVILDFFFIDLNALARWNLASWISANK
jgi:hypothetical protein